MQVQALEVRLVTLLVVTVKIVFGLIMYSYSHIVITLLFNDNGYSISVGGVDVDYLTQIFVRIFLPGLWNSYP